MIVIKKRHLESCALTLAAFGINEKKQTVPVSGLLYENITLGLKRRLQKIREAVMEHMQELQADRKEIDDKFPVAKPEKDKELTAEQKAQNDENIKKRKEEMEILLDEEVKIDQEKVRLDMIEAIQTDNNYDWQIIELIAE